jgi:predicted RNase H-like HicB family nuclease
MRVDYTVQIWKEDGQFVAQAMPIDVLSSGETVPAARIALDEAVQLFLETAREAGTLQEVLEECGYEIHDGSWRAPEWISVERHSALLGA